MPTIFAAAMLIDLPVVCVGFPSRLLIEPFLPWIQHRARCLHSQLLSHICVSWKLFSLIVKNELSFVQGDDHWLTRDYIGMSSKGPAMGWATCPLKEVYDSCGTDIQDEIILRHDETG